MSRAILLIFAIISVYGVYAIHLSESKSIGDVVKQPTNMTSFLDRYQALSYGDDCSWEAEQSRQNYVKRMSSYDFQALKDMTAEFLEKDYKLCSAAKLFVCDKETQKCVCGDAGFELEHGVNRELYILEANGTCRWNTDTYCTTAEEFLMAYITGMDRDFKCKTGTSCKTAEGNVCSRTEILRYVKNLDFEALVISNVKIEDKLIHDKVCSCQADQST